VILRCAKTIRSMSFPSISPASIMTSSNTSNPMDTLPTSSPSRSIQLRRIVAGAFLACLSLTGGVAQAQNILNPDRIVTSVLRRAPEDGDLGVALDRRAIIRFNGMINPTTVNGNSITVSSGGQLIQTELHVNLGQRSVILEFPGFLPSEIQIDVSVDGNVLLDRSGHGIDGDMDGISGGVMNYSFNTGIAVDPPVVTSAGIILGNVFHSDGTPLAGALIDSVYYPSAEGELGLPVPDGISDSAGYFEYITVPIVGEDTFLVRIRKDGYSEALRQVTLMADRCWRIEDAVLQILTPPVTVAASTGDTLQDPQGLVTLVIPPNALQQDSNIGVTILDDAALIRDELPPSVMPAGVFTDVAGVFGDATNAPVTFQVPNTYNLPVGTRLPMGKIDHNTLEWMDLRDAYTGPPPVPDEYLGEVKSDGMGGTFIEIQFDHFCTVCTGYCLPYGPGSATSGAGGNNGGGAPPCGGAKGNSVVGLREGHLWEDIKIPGFTERGKPFDLSLTYFSGGAYPSASVSATVDYNSTRPIEYNIFEFNVEALVLEGVYAGSANNQKPRGNYIWHGETGMGTLAPTGSYPFTIQFTSLNANAPVAVPPSFDGSWTGQSFGVNYPGIVPLASEEISGRVSIVNLQDSEYGSGWRVTEEDRLYFDPDGCIMLVYGTAQWLRYVPDPQDPQRWISPEEDFTTLLQNPQDGTFVRRNLQGGEDVFSIAGRLLTRTDRLGSVVRFERNMDLLTRVLSPTGFYFDFFYDGFGRLSRIDDSAGRSTQFFVDSFGDLTSETDAVGSTRTFEYDPNHLLTAHNGPRGERSEYDYDNGRIVATRAYDVGGAPLLRERHFEPSVLKGEIGTALALGAGTLGNPIPLVEDRVDLAIDGNGGIELHATDEEGRTLYREDALGRRTSYTYDAAGLIASRTRPNGWKTEYDYDQGELIATREYDGQSLYSSTSIELDPMLHMPKRFVDALGKEGVVTYDALGNVSILQDDLGNQLVLEYGVPGHPQQISVATLPGGIRREMDYDTHGNVIAFTVYPGGAFPQGRTHILLNGPTGEVIQSTDGEQRTTSFEYDAMDRVTKQVHADLTQTNYSYEDVVCGCTSADLTKVTLPDSTELNLTYDGLRRLIIDTDQLGNSRVFSYDPESNATSTTDREGDAVLMQYDPANQMVRRELPGAEVTTYVYDALGSPIQAANAMCILDFERDFLGRTTREESGYDLELTGGLTLSLDHVVDSAYDLVGNRMSLQDDAGRVDLAYTYDDLHRLQTLTDQLNPLRIWTFDYETNGLIGNVDRGMGNFSTSYGYDPIGRLASITHNTSQPVSVAYGAYDGSGDLTDKSVSGVALGQTHSHQYDDQRRLVSSMTASTNGDIQIAQSGIFDAANRLLNDGEYAYVYDLEGRMTERTDLSSGVVDRYTWDATGQLLVHEEWVDVNGTLTSVMTVDHCYDPLGRRIAKSINAVPSLFLYDGLDLLLELDGSGRTVRSYTHGLGVDDVLAFTDGVTGDHLHYITDRRGTVLGLAEDGGNVVQEYTYDEFGALLSESNPSLYQPFSYTGRERDLESGLHNYRARFYDAGNGRFLSPDPLGLATGENFYTYVGNNPINLIDPLGLASGSAQYWAGSIIGIIGSVAMVGGAGTLQPVAFGVGVGLVALGAYIASDDPCSAAANGSAAAAGAALGGTLGGVAQGALSTDTWRGVNAIVNRQKQLDQQMRDNGLEP
jgi:RHS repeat-associated protein